MSAEEKENEIIIRVEDKGIGIAPGQQEKVFEMFYRGSNRSVGSGLGLHIAKIAAEKMNGTLSIEKSDEEGRVFSVALQQASATARA